MIHSTELTKKEPIGQHHPRPLMEVHIVDKNDIFYTKGRNLAKTVYRHTWNTEHLIDGNDFAIVVSHQGTVVGNMNIQLRRDKKLLKSENFFGKKHWLDYFDATDSNIAELSALAIAQDAPTELRRPIMMLLIMGVQTLCRLEGIKFLVTVQHDYLIRILTKSLQLPFFQNQKIRNPQGNLPNDDYWKRVKPPALYYVEAHSKDIIDACYSFFTYLNLTGIQTVFLPRMKLSNLSFTTFRSEWKQEKTEAVALLD